MGRTNKTEYAILGLLSIEPMSGYDMKTFISKSIGFFWAASYGQLYPTLNALHKGRYVSKKKKPRRGKPDRNLYSITKKGRAKLVRWLESKPEPEPVRNELLLQIFLGSDVDRATLVDHVQSFMERQEKRLKLFKQIEQTELHPVKAVRSYPLWVAPLRYGIHISRAQIKWCKETMIQLKDEE